MPSRAFGDARYKWPASVQNVVLPHIYQGRRLIPRNYESPPYVISCPEVVHYERDDQDQFLILGTDGLWDELSSKEACDAVGGLEKKVTEGAGTGTSGKKENPATALIKAAYGSDIEHLLSLKAPTSRKYRDDLTVSVVRFTGTEGEREMAKAAAKPGVQEANLPRWVEFLRNWRAKL
jgi:pyruvate dehydrogenase phosphatase